MNAPRNELKSSLFPAHSFIISSSDHIPNQGEDKASLTALRQETAHSWRLQHLRKIFPEENSQWSEASNILT